MDSFLKSLKNETKMYQTTAMRINDARRDLNVEYEGVRTTTSRLFHANRPQTVAEKSARGRIASIGNSGTSCGPQTSRRSTSRKNVRGDWDSGTVWVTNAPSRSIVPEKTKKEYKEGTLTSRNIDANFDVATPRRQRVYKTPECVKRMRPNRSDYVTENDAFYERHVNDLVIEGRFPGAQK